MGVGPALQRQTHRASHCYPVRRGEKYRQHTFVLILPSTLIFRCPAPNFRGRVHHPPPHTPLHTLQCHQSGLCQKWSASRSASCPTHLCREHFPERQPQHLPAVNQLLWCGLLVGHLAKRDVRFASRTRDAIRRDATRSKAMRTR